ncbi:pancreatic triacylglycerol lipase-like [Chironomus tepperi]|uniref:pancreatic triacylglycerol lipase-like n=1 Tax=Chironomus tepperi TaxID=113505 RepID=UPI00391F754C
MLLKFLVFISALIAVANCDSRIIFRYYTDGISFLEYNTNTLPQVLSHPNFVRTRETVFYHYSNGESLVTPQVHDIVTSYASMQRANFIVIWYQDNNVVSTGNAITLASAIAQSLINFCEFGYNSALINLIGGGLGAQILARTSRTVQDNSNRRHVVGRLTGLDPQSMGAISVIQIGRLSPADAQWVETIHTDGTSLGDHDSRGHVHFFVNGGTNQPMCTQTLPGARAQCNYEMAMTYWAESVRSISPIFPSLYCDSWSAFISGLCNSNTIANMGRSNSATNLRGSYMLRTNNQPPFSRNQATP